MDCETLKNNFTKIYAISDDIMELIDDYYYFGTPKDFQLNYSEKDFESLIKTMDDFAEILLKAVNKHNEKTRKKVKIE